MSELAFIARITDAAAAFGAAADKLVEHSKKKGGDGILRDVEVTLAEDNQTVMMYADWEDDNATVYSSFTLAEPVAEEEFDASFYREELLNYHIKVG